MNSERLGRRLRVMRQQLGMTQTQLAGEGMSTSYISLLESGKRRPTPEVVLKLATRLNVPPELLLTGDDSTSGASQAAEDDIQLDLCDAHLSLLNDDVDAAWDGYRRIWKGAADDNDRLRTALLGLAWCDERRGDLTSAAARYEQWLGSVDDGTDDVELRVGTVTRLCRCRWETGQPQQASTLAEQTLAELRGLGLDRTAAAATLLAELISIYHGQNLTAPAERLSASLLAIRGGLTDLPAQRDIYWHASHSAREQGRHRLALSLARRAIGTHRFGVQHGLSDWIASTPVPGGDGTDQVSPTEAQLELLGEARQRLHGLAGPADAARCDVELAQHQLAAGHPRQAAESAAAALRGVGPGFQLTRAQASLVLAHAHRALNDPDQAIDAYERAAEQFTMVGMHRNAAASCLELAAYQDSQGQTDQALATYRRASATLGIGDGPTR